MNIAGYVKRYLELRAFKERATKEHEAKLKPYNDAMDAIEGAVQQFLIDSGQDNAKTEFGTVYRTTHMSVKMSDRETFIDFVKNSEDGMDYFTNAVAKEKVKEYLDGSAGQPPPGIAVEYIAKVNFRKA